MGERDTHTHMYEWSYTIEQKNEHRVKPQERPKVSGEQTTAKMSRMHKASIPSKHTPQCKDTCWAHTRKNSTRALPSPVLSTHLQGCKMHQGSSVESQLPGDKYPQQAQWTCQKAYGQKFHHQEWCIRQHGNKEMAHSPLFIVYACQVPKHICMIRIQR